MSKRKSTTLQDSSAKKKSAANFKTEWLSELVETDTPTTKTKAPTKLGDIFTYRSKSDDVVCLYCKDAHASGDFATGKRWDDWKIDYLKRHVTQKSHPDSVSTLRLQKNRRFAQTTKRECR